MSSYIIVGCWDMLMSNIILSFNVRAKSEAGMILTVLEIVLGLC